MSDVKSIADRFEIEALRDSSTSVIGALERFVSVMVTVTSFSTGSGLAHTCLSLN